MIGRLKTAAEVEQEHKALSEHNRDLLKSMVGGTVGLGAGTLGGYLGVKGIDALMRRQGGAGIPPAASVRYIGPLAGAGLGLALASWQAHQQELMRRARESR